MKDISHGIAELNTGDAIPDSLISFINNGNINVNIQGTPANTDKYALGYHIGRMTIIDRYTRNSGSEVSDNRVLDRL